MNAEPSPVLSPTTSSADRAALYDRFGAAAFSLCIAIVRDDETAADIVCECCRAAPAGESSDAGAWLLAEAHRRAVSALRASRTAGDADEAVVAGSQRLRAFGALDYEQRLTVGLVYYEGLTIADVARRFGFSPERVSRVLTSALRLMRETSVAVVTAGPVVDASTLERHRRTLQLALQRRPRSVCLDLTDTRVFDADGARFLAEAATRCDELGVQLRVLESPSVTVALQQLGLTDRPAIRRLRRHERCGAPLPTGGFGINISGPPPGGAG